jgi:hypothetical protein
MAWVTPSPVPTMPAPSRRGLGRHPLPQGGARAVIWLFSCSVVKLGSDSKLCGVWAGVAQTAGLAVCGSWPVPRYRYCDMRTADLKNGPPPVGHLRSGASATERSGPQGGGPRYPCPRIQPHYSRSASGRHRLATVCSCRPRQIRSPGRRFQIHLRSGA